MNSMNNSSKGESLIEMIDHASQVIWNDDSRVTYHYYAFYFMILDDDSRVTYHYYVSGLVLVLYFDIIFVILLFVVLNQ